MVWIDGYGYNLSRGQYEYTRPKAASEQITLTGDLSRTESGYFTHVFKFAVVVTRPNRDILQATHAKVTVTGTPAANKLLFVDRTGKTWSPQTGSNDSTHSYSTGAYWVNPFTYKAMDERGDLAQDQAFEVPIELHVVAKGATS